MLRTSTEVPAQVRGGAGSGAAAVGVEDRLKEGRTGMSLIRPS